MKLRMITGIAGTFHGDPNGAKRGDVVEIEDEYQALVYVANGLAIRDLKGEMPLEVCQEDPKLWAEIRSRWPERFEIPEESKPLGGIERAPIGSPYKHRFSRTGWGA